MFRFDALTRSRITAGDRGDSPTDVLVDGKPVTLHLSRHPRARRFRLRYDPLTDRLTLTLPPRANAATAQAWAATQSDWIRQQRERRTITRPVGPGEILPFRDGQLRIDWARTHDRAPRLEGAPLHLGGPESGVAGRVERWLRAQALADWTERTHRIAAGAGLSCTGVAVGDPHSRWGSCSSSGRIRYSWRLIMAPDMVREAIAAHEVAHLRHLNHGAAFHALADELSGGTADAAHRWLKIHGRTLHHMRFDRAQAG